MRACITGAKGMLGQELVRAFSDCEVIAWDRSDLDITDAVQVRERIAAVAPDVLVNAAAYNAVDRAEEEPAAADRVNGYAVGYLADAAARVGATFVHYSSDYVFSGRRESPGSPRSTPPSAEAARSLLSHGSEQSSTATVLGRELRSQGDGEVVGYAEDAVTAPVSAYGRSKLLGERELARVAQEYPALRWYCVRLSRLFGAAGASGGAKQSFVDAIRAKAATADRLEVIDAEIASPTYAPDLAGATRTLFSPHIPTPLLRQSFAGQAPGPPSRREVGDERGPIHAASGIYHRTNDGACTWHAFAAVVLAHVGWRGELVAVPPLRFPRPAQRPASSVLVTTKLPPLRRWEDALAAYIT